MPSLSSRQAEPIKMLLLGDSGVGKTGALASLAKAGYSLKIADFDNGLDILYSALSSDEKALARVEFSTFTEKMKNAGGVAVIDGLPRAWSSAMNQIWKWLETADQSQVFVLDSLTFAANAAMNQVLALNNRLGKKPYQSDWGEAQKLLEDLLAILYSSSVKCHVIVCTHVKYYDVQIPTGERDKDGEEIMKVVDTKGLPMAIGQALSPKIPRYFNHCLIVGRLGDQRFISTKPIGVVEAKSASISAPARLPLPTGLAQYFALFHKPPVSA